MDDIKWKYEKRLIDDLEENSVNPRRLSKKRADELKKSIEDFGVCQPIVIQPDGFVVGGHQRIRSIKAMGYNEVDCAVPSRPLSREEVSRLTIILNKVQGEFDFDMLANQWDPDLLVASGFTEEELHTNIIPEQKPKSLSINLKFENEDDLRHIERELEMMIGQFPSAQMKVKVK
jgi:ParB-like chromosome segregation protein Spo0J